MRREGEWTREEVTVEGKYSEQGRYSEGQGDSDGIREDEGKGHTWRLVDGPGEASSEYKGRRRGSYVSRGYPLRQPFISDFPLSMVTHLDAQEQVRYSIGVAALISVL